MMLQGKTDPEEKRKTIGGGFIEVFRDFAVTLKSKHGMKPKFLVQVPFLPIPASIIPHPGRPAGMVNATHSVSWQTVASLLAELFPVRSGLVTLYCGDDAVNAP